jgi:hypothetical protein
MVSFGPNSSRPVERLRFVGERWRLLYNHAPHNFGFYFIQSIAREDDLVIHLDGRGRKFIPADVGGTRYPPNVSRVLQNER